MTDKEYDKLVKHSVSIEIFGDLIIGSEIINCENIYDGKNVVGIEFQLKLKNGVMILLTVDIPEDKIYNDEYLDTGIAIIK